MWWSVGAHLAYVGHAETGDNPVSGALDDGVYMAAGGCCIIMWCRCVYGCMAQQHVALAATAYAWEAHA